MLCKVLPCPDATLPKRVVSLCQFDASQCVLPMNEVGVPSNLAKFDPTIVTKDAPNVMVLGGATVVTEQKSNEKDAETVESRSCEQSGSIAKVTTTGNPYDAPAMTSTFMLESDFHSVVSHAVPPKRAVGENSTRPRLSPKVVTAKEPEV